MRLVGLIMVAFCVTLFVINPEVVFGEISFLGKEIDSFCKVSVPSILADHKGGTVWFKWVENDISNELLLTIMLIGTYFIAFAKIKDEDEFSYQLRMESMSNAHIYNGILLLLANWLFYDGIFLYIMIWGLFSFLLIFSILFALKIRKYRKAISNAQ